MHSLRKNLYCLAIAIFALQSAGAHSGAADVRTNDGGQMKFEYDGDSQLRINLQQDGNYMVLKDGEIYMVTNAEGQVMVLSLKQTMSMFGNQADAASPSTVEGKLLSLDSTGRKETIAGIAGEVYDVRFIDNDGKERTTELVLASDRRAVEFQRALFAMTSSMARAAGKSVEGPEELQKRLTEMNKGTLRFGEDMWVTAISDRGIDPARFALPAEPTDMSAIGGMFGGSQSGDEDGSSGGFMSKIFGDQAERQKDRGENKADREVDRQTDEAVDSAIDKAFDKLFGR